MNAVYAARSEAQEMGGYKTLLLRSTPFLSYGRNVVTLKRTCLLPHISSAPFHLILTVVISIPPPVDIACSLSITFMPHSL